MVLGPMKKQEDRERDEANRSQSCSYAFFSCILTAPHFFLFKRFISFCFMCMCECLHICVHVTCVSGVYRGQNEVELQAVVRCLL